MQLPNQSVMDFSNGNHYCLFYEKDPVEQLPILIPYIIEGLKENQQCIYIADDLTKKQLLLLLKAYNVNVDRELKTGRLKIWGKQEWRQPGGLDPELMYRQVMDIIAKALEEGYKGVRFAGEMTWTQNPDLDLTSLEEWEYLLNTIFPLNYHSKFVCQYNKSKFPQEWLNMATSTHNQILSLCCSHIHNEKDKDDQRSIAIGNLLTDKVEYTNFNYHDLTQGSHICNFYRTKEELIDILVPYFKAGLDNNEYCIWVTSILNAGEAKTALQKVIPDIDKYFEKGQIEIVDADNWYLENGVLLDLDLVLNKWLMKEEEALNKGFTGLRVTGNTYFLEQKDRSAFQLYEKKVNDAISKYKMVVLCSYSLDKCTPSDIVDVVSSHQSTFLRKDGKLKYVQSKEHLKAQLLLMEACTQLENKVAERTSELSRSLNEKEVLLKEIHHRVKNNMQVVASLLRLQTMGIKKNDTVNRVFNECQNRIKSMALVHEALYKSKDFATLNLRDYVSCLSADLLHAYNLNSKQIKFEINIDNATLDIDTSISCGLILTELIMNSIKYAFPNEREGKITISFSSLNGLAKLTVADNGVGMEEKPPVDEPNTLGLKLVASLVEQLSGNLKISNNLGTEFLMEFPYSETAVAFN